MKGASGQSLHLAGGPLSEVQRGKSAQVPPLRLLRDAAVDQGTGGTLRSHEVRRTVSILFCDLKDSTSLGERLDPEALHELKERYFAAMAAEIIRHGGKIEKYIGDAIMAVFDLPVQHEDDALRAVRAAAGMRTALLALNKQLESSYGLRLDNRTGVNTGEVVANDDPAADQKLATGDTVNVAARLEQAAPTNEIYIGKTTWQLVQHAVEVEAVAPLTIKGKQEGVPAFRLVSVIASHHSAGRRRDTPLIGRDRELLTIRRLLRAVSETGTARLVTLVGDAGIGKSRLAQEVIGSGSARVLHGRCLAYGEGITFWPFRPAPACNGHRLGSGDAMARCRRRSQRGWWSRLSC
jgi:class 3 adenylate cyclase